MVSRIGSGTLAAGLLLSFACGPAEPNQEASSESGGSSSTGDVTPTSSSETGTGPAVTSGSGESTSTVPSTTSESTAVDTTTVTSEPGGCEPDSCAAPNPFCAENGECVSCSEIDCAAIDPGQPVCDADSGLCVECVSNGDCGESSPFCDPGTGTCQSCTLHENCPDSACNLETGECFPEDNVVFVENTPASCSDAADNDGKDPASPFCRLGVALAKAGVTPLTIKLKQGQLPQSEANVVSPGRDGGDPAEWQHAGLAGARRGSIRR